MREIKFRAWDKKNCEMLGEFTTEDFFNNSGMMYNNHSDCVFRQYTGLKDKNGNEICEGDVVKWGDHCNACRETPVRIAKVEINPDIQFVCINIDKIFQFGSFAYQDTRHLEIIGNIYENPDLLK